MIDIGNRIRQLRIKNELTLQELASRTELTKGFLSQLERNLTAPSLTTLDDICEALGTDLGHFFTEEGESKAVFTPEDAFIDEQDDMTIHWIVPSAQKNIMEPILLEIEPMKKSMIINPHDGEEMGYVLSGRVVLVRESDRKGIAAKKGDTFYLRGSETHYLENRTRSKAVVLWISTPPVF